MLMISKISALTYANNNTRFTTAFLAIIK